MIDREIDLGVLQFNDRYIERIFANLESIGNINGVLCLKYVGPEDKKDLVLQAFKTKKPFIDQLVKSSYPDIKKVVIRNNIDEIKLEWLEKLIEKFEPKGVQISIMKAK